MELWIGALNLGLLYAFLAIGTLITGRILKFNDITVDGSFTTGAAVSAILIANGWDPFTSIAIASLVGAIAGMITGIIHTSLKVDSLLSGILVMIALYSINLHIMGRSNIPLINADTIFTRLNLINPGLPSEIWIAVSLIVISSFIWLLIAIFFKTDLGYTVQSTGDNRIMTSASGINVNAITIFGVMLANAFVGFSGALIAQYQGFADIGMGIGSLIIGLASVIIGETIFRSRNIFIVIGSAFLGSIIYRYMIAFALWVGMNPIDLKLITAFFVLLTLIITKITKKGNSPSKSELLYKWKKYKKIVISILIFITLGVVGIFLIRPNGEKNKISNENNIVKKYKIGVIQLSENSLLNITRDAFYAELKRLGIKDSCEIIYQDANGDVQLANQIIANFKMKKVNAIISFSTPTTQAAMGKVKDTPIIFATVANPFIINAGESDSVHLPNITGTYGSVDMATLLNMACDMFGRKIRIGAIWDPGHANAVYNVDCLKKAIAERKHKDVILEGITVSGSNEVYEAAETICNKKIDALVLPPDNIVYNAIESVVKAADKKKIPVFSAEASALERGVTATFGYDYTESGIKAAHLLKKILLGVSPNDLPFEKYKLSFYGVNYPRLKKYNLQLPDKYKALIKRYVDNDNKFKQIMPTIGMVQFAVEPMVEFCKVGIFDAMAERGFIEGQNFKIVYKNANGDFNMIAQIMQDLNRRNVDIIVPLSTPVVQGAIQAGGKTNTKVIYTYTFDPFSVGAAKSPTDHLPWATGSACPPKIDVIFQNIKEAFPKVKRYGVVYNSSEANSVTMIKKMRAEAKKQNVELIEMVATSSAEVLDASNALANKKAEIFIAPGDNTVTLSIDTYAKTAHKLKIPLISFDADHATNGYAVLACGSSYYQTGYEAGDYIARVLIGENPAKMPVIMTQKMDLLINDSLVKALKIKINKNIYKKANSIIGQKKESKKKSKKLALVLFNENPILLETANGIKDVLDESNILEKKGIQIDSYNAQGEFTLAQSITQKIIEDKYDYIVSCSTPVLQVIANMNSKIPHIFGAVTDPYRMGVAKSNSEHRENITGVATFQPIEKIVALARELFPKSKTIGCIYNPAEACSEACMEKIRIFAKKYGYKLKVKTISNTNEAIESAGALFEEKIDIFITAGDNTVKASMPGILSIAERKKIPCFSDNPLEVKKGYTGGVGADYYQVGKKVAYKAIEVINGRKPKNLTILDYCPDAVGINLKLVKKFNGKMPSTEKQKACMIIEK